MSAPPQFLLRQVQRRWDERVALTGIDLRIDAGERLALIGPSGSGKTTLLRLLMASLQVSKGSIEVAGRDIGGMSPSAIRAHRQRCGLVSQDLQLVPRSTVHASVLAGCVARWPWWRVLASLLWPLERERISALLAEVGIAERQWDAVGQLSGGQRQRVCIARALAGDQSVLLADEPTAALDPSTGAEVIALLASETRQRAATLIISTHRVSEVREQVDRIIGLRDGKIFFDRSANEIDEPMLERLYAGSGERS